MLGFTFSSNTREAGWWAYEGCGYDEFVYDWSGRCGFYRVVLGCTSNVVLIGHTDVYEISKLICNERKAFFACHGMNTCTIRK